MTGITITLRGAGLEAFAGDMLNLSKNARREMERGLINGGDKLRTEVRRALQEQTGVLRYGTITRNTRGYLDKGGLAYVIVASGSGLPIKEFRTSASGRARYGDYRDQKRDGAGRFGGLKSKGGGVTSAVWNAPRTFQRSYKRKDGGFVAALPGSWAERKLFGPSLPKELTVDQSVAAFEAGAGDILDAVLARLEALMG